MLKKLIIRLIAKYIGSKIKLVEGGSMDKSKKWYVSKTIWCAIVTVLVGLYQSVDSQLGVQLGFNLPDIPAWVDVILGALIGYSRVAADKVIK